MYPDILFETNRFNLSEFKENFINPCCFGDDLANWLRTELQDKNIPTTEPGQEDWGWYLDANHEGATYFIGIGGNPNDSAIDPNEGEWRLMIKKHRSLWDRLSGKNKPTPDEPILGVIIHLLEEQPDFKNIRRE